MSNKSTPDKVRAERESFGKQIRKAREGKGLSQSVFGKPLGLTQKAVSRYERGVGADAKIMNKIAKALGIKLPSEEKIAKPCEDRKARKEKEVSSPFRELIKMIRGPAFSGYAIARKSHSSVEFLMASGEWGADITVHLRLFDTAVDAKKALGECKGDLVFYADFAFSPLIESGAEEGEKSAKG